MASVDDTQKGYVYILTNQSFREDWIKIGKSSRPVDVRSRELDNTAVPLPFEIYATMKTASYNKVESMLHRILEGAHARIRNNREFFNVTPEVALDAFYDIAELLPDAEVYLKGEEPSKKLPERKSSKDSPKRRAAFSKPSAVKVHSTDFLPKGARFSLDGAHFVSMSKFAFLFIHQYLLDNPSLTFQQLANLFPKSMLSSFQYCGVVATKDTVENSTYPLASKIKAYHYGDVDYLLHSADGIDFYTTTQWTRDSFRALLVFAEDRGYQVFVLKK